MLYYNISSHIENAGCRLSKYFSDQTIAEQSFKIFDSYNGVIYYYTIFYKKLHNKLLNLKFTATCGLIGTCSMEIIVLVVKCSVMGSPELLQYCGPARNTDYYSL